MPNRRLTEEQLVHANALLRDIRARLEVLGGGDRELLFAYRRKVFKELTYDERDKPAARTKLKTYKWNQQDGKCALCGEPLPQKYSVLDRLNAVDGYSEQNTRLVHPTCDITQQASKRYT